MRIEIGPKGPEAIRARMEEIRAKMSQAFPTEAALPAPGSKLGGQIGGYMPFNPFDKGTSLSPMAAPENLRSLIEEAANQNNIDPALFDALIATESAYDPMARSTAGAMGLSQLMPTTAKSLGVSNPFDPVQNLNGGAKYLSQMLSKFGGDAQLALAAYNAGPGAVEKYNGVPPYKQTQDYVKKIMALYSHKSRP